MRVSVKIALIVALVLFFIGFCVSFSALFLLDFDFAQLNTAEMETNTHVISTAFRHVSIGTDVAAVQLLPAENDVCTVICHELEKAPHTISVQGDTLVIEANDHRKWYEMIGIFIGDVTVTVYLPPADYGQLEAETDTGSIKVNSAFTFESANAESDTGSISWEADIKQDLSLNTDTGSIYISAKNVEGNISAETDTGKIQLMSVHCKNVVAECSTGSVILTNTVASESFDIQTSTGSVELNRADAGEIRIKTSTGSVRGTLLTEKIFITETSTGRINVPKTNAGGRCEITTSTGSINISIAE